MRKKLNSGTLLSAILILCFGAFVSNAQTGANGSLNVNTPVQTNFGVLVQKTNDDINVKLVAANNLLSAYVRDQQFLTKWNGTKNTDVDFWLAHDKKVLLNINNDTTPSAFPKNLAAYENKLRSVLDVYGNLVELVVIENEELNRYDSTSTGTIYHYGSMQDYINELTVAVSVCIEKGVPVTNGGLTNPIVSSLMHYYDTHGKADSSTWLQQQMGGISPDSTRWLRTDSLLNAYRDLPLSYVNLHWYEPQKGRTTITTVLQTICNYITQQTGKKTISNETGNKSTDSSIITKLMQQWDSVDAKYCIFFDGAGAQGAKPLTTAPGALLPNGIAFRNYNFGAITSCPQTISITPAGPINLCQGFTSTLTAASGFGNYLWSSGATSQSITVNSPGNYSVTSNQGSCIAFSSNTVIVNVNPLPAKPIITPSGSTTNICPSKTVKLTCSAAPSYLWSTGATTKYINVNAGTYTVTIIDANGCKNTSDPTVVTGQPCNKVTNLHVTDIGKDRATLNWDTAVCALKYELQYRKKGVVTWTVIQISTGGTSSKSLTGLLAGTTYQWKILTRCKITPDTIASTFAVGPEFTTLASPCNPPTNLNVTGITAVKATINWDTAANAIGYEYEYRIKGVPVWIVIPVTGGAATHRTLFSLTPATIYEWAIRTKCKNATDTASIFAAGPDFTTLTSFVQAGAQSENAKNMYAFDVEVYPNPAKNNATVTISKPANDLEIILTDLSGKIFWQSEKITDKNIKLPVANLANGVYILIVKDAEHSKTLKFVKE